LEGIAVTQKDLETVVTPSLLLDLDQLEKNIQDIMEVANSYGVHYRPHVKTHKSVEIARRQIKAGAIGLTVAKVGEAEVMADAGVKDILIAFPISDTQHLERIQALRGKTKITLMIDSVEQADKVGEFFDKENPLPVWIKVNSGLNRCGVEPNEGVLELAKHIQAWASLKLEGIFTHAGQTYGAKSKAEIEKIAAEEVRIIKDSAALCESQGISIEHRSVGSTPAVKLYPNMDGITEIRPGNAVFYDMVQVGLGVAEKEQCALTVLSSVASIQTGRIVLDAGSKALALDKGAHGNDVVKGHGHIREHEDLVIESLSEEHGVIPTERTGEVTFGEKLTIIPNHACPVVNLFDYYTVHKDGKVIDYWSVSARGKNS